MNEFNLHKYVGEREDYQDWGKYTDINGKTIKKPEDNQTIEYISYELSAGNVPFFVHDGQPYIVLKAGYNKEGYQKKFKIGKGKQKVKDNQYRENLATETAPAETYEEIGVNTTTGGNKIIKQTGLISFEDNKKFGTEDNRKDTKLNFQATIFSKKRTEQLLNGIKFEDRGDGDKYLVKAIPLDEIETAVDPKQVEWIKKGLAKFENGLENIENETEAHREEVCNRLDRILEIRRNVEEEYNRLSGLETNIIIEAIILKILEKADNEQKNKILNTLEKKPIKRVFKINEIYDNGLLKTVLAGTGELKYIKESLYTFLHVENLIGTKSLEEDFLERLYDALVNKLKTIEE